MLDDLGGRERARNAHRRLVTERGPDTGRRLDHLKARSTGGAPEALVSLHERGAVAMDNSEFVTRRDAGGDSSSLLFMYDVSGYDGSDVYGD